MARRPKVFGKPGSVRITLPDGTPGHRNLCGWCGKEWNSRGETPPTRCQSPYTRKRDGKKSGGCGHRNLKGPTYRRRRKRRNSQNGADQPKRKNLPNPQK